MDLFIYYIYSFILKVGGLPILVSNRIVVLRHFGGAATNSSSRSVPNSGWRMAEDLNLFALVGCEGLGGVDSQAFQLMPAAAEEPKKPEEEDENDGDEESTDDDGDEEEISDEDSDVGSGGEEEEGAPRGRPSKKAFAKLKKQVKQLKAGKKKVANNIDLDFKCIFRCGATRRANRWGRKGKKGAACWSCYRAFRVLYSHSQTIKQAVETISKDGREHEKFFAKKKSYDKHPGGVKRLRLKKKQILSSGLKWKEKLMMPDQGFMKWSDYKATFGAKVRRKMGHVRRELNGIDGVQIPTKKKMMKIRQELESYKDLNTVHATEQDVDEDCEMLDKFQDLVDQSTLGQAEGMDIDEIYKASGVLLDFGFGSGGGPSLPPKEGAGGREKENDANADKEALSDDDEEEPGTLVAFGLQTGGPAGSEGRSKVVKKKKGTRGVIKVGKNEKRQPIGTKTPFKTPKQPNSTPSGDGQGGRGRKARTFEHIMQTWQAAVQEFCEAHSVDAPTYADEENTHVKLLQRYAREAQAKEKAAEGSQNPDQAYLGKVKLEKKKLQIVEAVLKTYRQYLKEGPEIDLLTAVDDKLDFAARDPVVLTLRLQNLPLCLRRDMHELRIARFFPGVQKVLGVEFNTLEMLSIPGLKPLYPEEEFPKIQLRKVREGTVSCMRDGTLAEKGPTLQMIFTAVRLFGEKREPLYCQGVVDEVHEVRDMVELKDEKRVEVLLEKADAAPEAGTPPTILQQLKHHPVGVEIRDLATVFLKSLSGAALLNSKGPEILNMLATTKYVDWEDSWLDENVREKRCSPIHSADEFARSVGKIVSENTIQPDKLAPARASLGKVAEGLGVHMFAMIRLAYGALIEFIRACQDGKEPKPGVIDCCMFFVKVISNSAFLCVPDEMLGMEEMKIVQIRGEDKVLRETAEAVEALTEAVVNPLTDENAVDQKNIADVSIPDWANISPEDITIINQYLKESVRAPADALMRNKVKPFADEFVKAINRVWHRQDGEKKVTHINTPLRGEALSSISADAQQLIALCTFFNEPKAALKVAGLSCLAKFVLKLQTVKERGFPKEVEFSSVWRVGSDSGASTGAFALAKEFLAAGDELERCRKDAEEAACDLEFDHEWIPGLPHVNLDEMVRQVQESTSEFKDGLKKLMDHDVDQLSAAIVNSCPLGIEEMGDELGRNAPNVRKLLNEDTTKNLLTVQDATLKLLGWSSKGFAAMKSFGIPIPNADDLAEMKLLTTLGRRMVGCTITLDFATNKVKELASEPAKVKDGAKQILEKLASSKTTIPDNLMKLLCTMAGVPVPQPGDEGAGAVEMGSPKVADLKTAPRSARRDSLEDTVKAKRAEDHAEADADVNMDGSGVVGEPSKRQVRAVTKIGNNDGESAKPERASERKKTPPQLRKKTAPKGSGGGKKRSNARKGLVKKNLKKKKSGPKKKRPRRKGKGTGKDGEEEEDEEEEEEE